MYSKTILVANESGLHARPAADFVKAAAAFKSTIKINRADSPERAVNAKSMVLVLSLAAVRDTEITLCASGEDEREAVDSLAELIESGFGEEL